MKKFLILILLLIVGLSILGLSSRSLAGDSQVVTVTATVLSKSQCKFNSKTAALSFGNIDPSTPVDTTVTTSITFRCGGSSPNATFSITDDDGLYETGPDANRMRHSINTTEYIPYTLTLNPTSGTVPKNSDQNLTITGTVKGVDYQDALTGSYSDMVVISIAP